MCFFLSYFNLFKKLIEINGTACLYASNTSSIPITKIAASLSLPHLVLGIHFFNPAQIMKLVEIIKGAKTEASVIEVAQKFVASLKKTGVLVADAPGFIVNRVAAIEYFNYP